MPFKQGQQNISHNPIHGFASHAICANSEQRTWASVWYESLLLYQLFCGWTDEQRCFQARPGGWTSPQPKAERLLVGKGCAHFLGSDPPSGPFLLLFFAFYLLSFCIFFVCIFLRFSSVFCDFWHRSIPNWRFPIWIGELPGRLATCPLVPPSPPFPLPLPSPSPFLPLSPLPSVPFPLSPSPPSLPIPFLLLSLPSLPSSYPSPSPSPRPKVSRLRTLVFLTSNPLAREVCFAHVLCKGGPLGVSQISHCQTSCTPAPRNVCLATATT